MIRRTYRCAAVLSAVLLAVAATACGDGDSGGGAASTDSGRTGASVEVAEEYLRALAQEGDRTLDTMVTLASPGSVADLYARHTKALNDIRVEAGETPATAEVSVDGDSVIVDFASEDGSTTRTEWSDFEVDSGGLLSDFTIDGVRLDDRLAGSGDPVVVDGVSARVVSGFQLVTSDTPLVVVEIDNGSDGTYVLDSATYRTPDGDEFATGPSGDGLGVPPGGSSRVALIFEPAAFGGSVLLRGDVDGADVPHELTLDS